MLWAIILSIAFKIKLKKIPLYTHSTDIFEHTPGFYELESVRLGRYATAMDKKLVHAMSRHERASNSMFYTARKCKPSAIQNRAFFRLMSSDKRVLHAKKLATNANQDFNTIDTIRLETNAGINITYDLAYKTKIAMLKHQLSKIHIK